MTTTEKMLTEIYGSTTMDTEQLAKEFHLADAKVVRDLIAQGTFYVPTYKLTDRMNSKIVADVAVVAAYLDARKAPKAA